MAPSVVLYSYPFSPFATKIAMVLSVKRIPFKVVSVADRPPRPELEEIGVTYRRIPVLSIDGDVFLDTSLICEELERRFTVEDGYETLWPGESSSLSPLLYGVSRFWFDRKIFGLVAAMIPDAIWADESFRKDREQLLGTKIDASKLKALGPSFLSSIQNHIGDLETQLKLSNKKFIFSDDKISMLDISFYHLMNFLRALWGRDKSSEVYHLFNPKGNDSSFPRFTQWMKSMDTTLHSIREKGLYPQSKVKGPIGGERFSSEDAMKLIQGSQKKEIKFDENDSMIKNGWFKRGDQILVSPSDTGKVPQAGILVGLTTQTGTVEIKSKQGKPIHLHFPRHEFTITKPSKSSKL